MKKQNPRYTRTITIEHDPERHLWWVVEKDRWYVGAFKSPREARHAKRQWFLYMNTPNDNIAYQYLTKPCPSK